MPRPQPTATLIRNVRVLSFDDDDAELERADILIEGASIAAVGSNLPPPPGVTTRVISADGHLAMPGLVNGHYHSTSALYRGAFEGAPLEIIMLYQDPVLEGRLAAPRFQYLRALLGAVEMLKLGVTAVRDDAYLMPNPTPEAMDAVMQAYADSGMRAEVTLDVGNVPEMERHPYLRELLPEDVRREIERDPIPASGDLLAIYKYMIGRWHGGCDGRLTVGVSCSAPMRATTEHLQALDELSRRHGLSFNAHILETRVQRALGQVRYGKSLIRYVHDLGLLSERMAVIHAVWTDEADIRLMADSGCVVAHNPVSNLKLGSGVMPFRRLRESGVPICLGSDEFCADDSANMWSVAKTAALIQKINEPDYRRWPPAREILQALIRGGARALRREGRGGFIAPGADADLILVDLDTLAFTPLNDLRRQLLYVENGSSVALTMVAGRIVAERGRILTVNEAELKAEVRELAGAHGTALANLVASSARREPYYRAMYERAAAQDFGFKRAAGPIEP